MHYPSIQWTLTLLRGVDHNAGDGVCRNSAWFDVFDVKNCVLHSSDLRHILVRYGDTKLILESHHQFYDVEAISTKVLEKAGFRRHLIRIDTHIFHYDLYDPFGDIAHMAPGV